MTQPIDLCKDRALEVADVLLAAQRKIWDPTRPDECKPLGEGTDTVRFFASAVTPLAFWDALGSDEPCSEPYVWVRLMSRYRSEEFPQAGAVGACGGVRVVEFEVGMGRCTDLGREVDHTELAREQMISADDSFQIESVLCMAAGELKTIHNIGLIATDTIVPYGPDGGVQGWSGALYAGF